MRRCGGKVWGNKLMEGSEGREEGILEEGKEGDKFKECSETTEPLFLLKEPPAHTAPAGGRGYGVRSAPREPRLFEGLGLLTTITPRNSLPGWFPKWGRRAPLWHTSPLL